MSKRIGVYPGTFDPVTDGHMDIIRRATSICDHLIVGCARNAGKGPLFSLDDRDVRSQMLIQQANVKVAQANLEQGEAELNEAERGFNRSRELLAKNFVAQAAHERAAAVADGGDRVRQRSRAECLGKGD